jgi:hypothetical protein
MGRTIKLEDSLSRLRAKILGLSRFKEITPAQFNARKKRADFRPGSQSQRDGWKQTHGACPSCPESRPKFRPTAFVAKCQEPTKRRAVFDHFIGPAGLVLFFFHSRHVWLRELPFDNASA